MNDAVNHLRANMDTKVADYRDAKSIAGNSQWNYEANQDRPSPAAL